MGTAYLRSIFDNCLMDEIESAINSI